MAELVKIRFFNLILVWREINAFLETEHQVVLPSLTELGDCSQLLIAQPKSTLVLFLSLFEGTFHSVL